MSIEFYNCSFCDEIFADCGIYFKCEDCGEKYCSNDCAKINQKDGSCQMCRNEYIPDFDLLNFLLNYLKKDKKWLEELYRENNKS
jgi:hypothetical protein